jgi:hypothetical protein
VVSVGLAETLFCVPLTDGGRSESVEVLSDIPVGSGVCRSTIKRDVSRWNSNPDYRPPKLTGIGEHLRSVAYEPVSVFRVH